MKALEICFDHENLYTSEFSFSCSRFFLDSRFLPDLWYLGDTGFSEYHGFFLSMAGSLLVVLLISILAAKIRKS